MADSLTEVEKYAQNESGTQKQVHPDDEEEEVDTVFKDLKEKHGNNFDTPRLF